MRLQRVLVFLLAAIMSILVAYVVIGDRFAFGPVMVTLRDSHGIHLADVPVVGLWAVGMAICAVLWVRPPSRD